jgi:hypothetical protein
MPSKRFENVKCGEMDYRSIYFILMNFRSGAGNHYGTFSGPVDAFSPVNKGKKSYKSPGRNFTTNPPKKGTGYGYLGVTIGATPKYTPDPYERAKEIRNVRIITIGNYNHATFQ